MAIPKAFITMSMRETDRLKTIQAVVDRMVVDDNYLGHLTTTMLAG